MSRDTNIKQALDRVAATLKKRPTSGRKLHKATLRLEDGLKCTFSQGGKSVVLDQPELMGGEGQGPTPGFFGRAAIAGCLAQGIKQTAAWRGVPISAITIQLEQELDGRGAMAMDDVYAGALDLRISIDIKSDASREVIQEVVDDTIEIDTWLLNYRDAQKLSTELKVLPAQTIGAAG